MQALILGRLTFAGLRRYLVVNHRGREAILRWQFMASFSNNMNSLLMATDQYLMSCVRLQD